MITPEERAELREWLSHPADPEGNAPLTRREARDLLNALDAAEAERDALRATVERVRALHRPTPNLVAFTRGGDRVVEDRCAVCGTGYPCPTIRALDGGE